MNRLEPRRRLAVVLGAPGALLVVEREQELTVTRQSQGVDRRVLGRAVAGQEKGTNLEPVPLDVGEGDVMPAGGHYGIAIHFRASQAREVSESYLGGSNSELRSFAGCLPTLWERRRPRGQNGDVARRGKR